MIIQSVGNIFGVGVPSYISRCLGAKRYDEVNGINKRLLKYYHWLWVYYDTAGGTPRIFTCGRKGKRSFDWCHSKGTDCQLGTTVHFQHTLEALLGIPLLRQLGSKPTKNIIQREKPAV